MEETTTKSAMLIGMFNDSEGVQNAYDDLDKRGYSKDDINLVM